MKTTTIKKSAGRQLKPLRSQDIQLSVKLLAYSAAALLSIRLYSLMMHLAVAMTTRLSLTGVRGLNADIKDSKGLRQTGTEVLSPSHCSTASAEGRRRCFKDRRHA